jgi:hypothetical protein
MITRDAYENTRVSNPFKCCVLLINMRWVIDIVSCLLYYLFSALKGGGTLFFSDGYGDVTKSLALKRYFEGAFPVLTSADRVTIT